MYVQSWTDNEIINLKLLDVNGKEITIHKSINSKTNEIDLRNLAQGVYSLVISFREGVAVKKIVVAE